MENIHSTVAERIVNCEAKPIRYPEDRDLRGVITAEDLFEGLDVNEAESAIADLLRGANPVGNRYLNWVGTALPHPPTEEYLTTKHEVTHCAGANYTFVFSKDRVEDILELASIMEPPVLDPSSSVRVDEDVVNEMTRLHEAWWVAGGGVAEIPSATIRESGASLIPALSTIRPERPLLTEYSPDTPARGKGTRFLRFDSDMYSRILSVLYLCNKYGMGPGECHDQDGSWGVFFK